MPSKYALIVPFRATFAFPGMPVVFEIITLEVLTDVKLNEMFLLTTPFSRAISLVQRLNMFVYS